ncbi:MAG: Arginine--tRNA ligase [Candidatus Omnitrophica bacterium]|nr:Arginine--tRNA ligase [Candidatus Omnitrophota bacterium]
MSRAAAPIRTAIAEAVRQAASASGLGEYTSEDVLCALEVPREEKHGDLSCHIALRASKERKCAPRPLADKLSAAVAPMIAAGGALYGRVARTSVEGAGFLNFYYSEAEIVSVLAQVRAAGDAYGRPSLQSRRVLLEYVSANPTGPLTVAHGRQAALGDSLARILRHCGHRVTTEYYNNDEGVQITTLGHSLQYRLRQITGPAPEEPMPENYYQGEYLIDIARQLSQERPKATFEECRVYARDLIMTGIRKDLADFDVTFDSYYSQEELGRSGRVERTLEELRKRGVVYESEGATWLRSTDYGDDKDRVLIKSDGNYTYLTPDIAYHHHKFERGFEEIVNILGPDHHGYIARLKASQAALGHDATRIRVLIAQLVTLYEGDRQVRMSTRAGEFVTLRQVMDEVGRDAGRFFFLMRKFDAHLDFDLQLAKSQSMDNPVFYIQYAHARIESVTANYAERTGRRAPSGPVDASLLKHPLELRLLRVIGQFEDALAGAERTLEPYRLVPYLTELAQAFHRSYAENRVVTDDAALTEARMELCLCTQAVLRLGLGLLGLSAPSKM